MLGQWSWRGWDTRWRGEWAQPLAVVSSIFLRTNRIPTGMTRSLSSAWTVCLAQHLARSDAEISLGILALLLLGIGQVEQGSLMQSFP